MLNHICMHDVSDEDCYKCAKHGIVFRCPDNCSDFDDSRKYMDKKTLEARKKIMKQMGIKDTDKYEWVGEI